LVWSACAPSKQTILNEIVLNPSRKYVFRRKLKTVLNDATRAHYAFG